MAACDGALATGDGALVANGHLQATDVQAPLAGGNVPAPNGHLLAAEGPAPVPGANFPAADCHIPAADFPAAGDQPLAASGYPANAFMPQLVMLPPPVTIDVFYCGMEDNGLPGRGVRRPAPLPLAGESLHDY